ncbi:MAG TPA: hypothetical protein VM534_00095 [Thermoanaerobaculia bacterium]|nr:hypothetical protein [Thermoanaerobaculia bacterium]
MRKLLLVLLVAMIPIACGKRGTPKPPVPVIPKETTDLVVAQRGPKLILSWNYPSVSTAGRTLPDLESVHVYRYQETLPPALAGSETEAEAAVVAAPPETPRAITLFERVSALTPAQFDRLKSEIARIDAAGVAALTAGATLRFEDRPPLLGDQGEPVRYTYAVAAVAGDGRSALSNLVTVVPLDVPLPPANLRQEVTPPAVRLEWDTPAGTILGAEEPQIRGYLVYRLPEGETRLEPMAPVDRELAPLSSYADTPSYGTHRYAVTAVMYEGPPRAESDFPLMISAEFRDLLPPPAPEGIVALVEEAKIRLVWEPVQAADLAGYRLYRLVGTGRTPLTPGPIQETLFTDTTPPVGVEYSYGVSSIDQNGNESELTMTQTVLVAR